MTEPYVTITLEGPPRGKGRPRGRIVKPRRGRAFISFYTDAATRAYEADLRAVAVTAMEGLEVLDEALSVLVEAFVPIPTSWSRKAAVAAIEGDTVPTGKPDADNFVKVIDAFNGVVWRDDSLIVNMSIRKTYNLHPALRVSVWKWFDTENTGRLL